MNGQRVKRLKKATPGLRHPGRRKGGMINPWPKAERMPDPGGFDHKAERRSARHK